MKKKLATHHLECYLTSGRIEMRKRVSRLEAEHPNPRQLLQLIAKSLLPNLFSYSHPLPPVQLLPIALHQKEREREFVRLDAFSWPALVQAGAKWRFKRASGV